MITGYRALVDPAALDKMLTAFVELRPLAPAEDDNIAEKVSSLTDVVSCYSVAGQASHILMVQVGSPQELETLLSRIRQLARVSTETTLVLSVAFEDRPLV